MILSTDQARDLTRRILGLSKAAEALVRLDGVERNHTRFANNGITTSGSSRNLTVSIVSVFGKRHASASTNLMDDASLAEVVQRSEALARLAPEDPEWMSILPPQNYLPTEAYDDPLARLTPQDRARGIVALSRRSGQAGILASGFYEQETRASGIATSRGLFAHHPRTEASFSTTARTRDGSGSGWAGSDVGRLGDLDVDRLGRAASDKAVRSASPKELPPGKYTVILEPQAVADLISNLAESLDARDADEGRSVFSRPGGGSRIGERMVSPKVDLISEPARSGLAGIPFDDEGLPAQRVTWFEKGELRHLQTSRYWALKNATQPTGPMANLILPGGTDSLEAMIRSTERGILVTRFWYIRFVDPQTLLLTGITRDGTFLVEKGKIAHPVRNFRFNESPLSLLRNVEMISAPRRVVGQGIPMAMPAIKSHDFTFSSVSQAV